MASRATREQAGAIGAAREEISLIGLCWSTGNNSEFSPDNFSYGNSLVLPGVAPSILQLTALSTGFVSSIFWIIREGSLKKQGIPKNFFPILSFKVGRVIWWRIGEQC